MKRNVKLILAALIVMVALIAAGTAYAKSRKPVLVVVCPVQTTVIDYVINPEKVTLIAYEKCLIYRGNRAAKSGGGAVIVPPGDPPNDPPVDPPAPPNPPTDPPGKPKPPACTKSNGKAPFKNPHCNGSK